MSTLELPLPIRAVVTGMEGCGKSSKIFELLKDLATTENPILFGVKNYTLMEEQIENWSERYSIPKEEFAICGWYTKYERANQAYTNAEIPFLLGEKTKYVFTTQAQIQRNRHKEFVTRKNNETNIVNWQYVIIDEWEYVNGLIPTLDYYFSRVKEFGPNEELSKLKRQKFDWIAQNYTFSDVREIQIKQTFSEVGFTVAHWIKEINCPLVFLTSELLAKDLLLSLPEKELNSEKFVEINVGSPDFKDCVVHTYCSPYVNKELFNAFAETGAWDKLGFDFVISDNINSWYEKPENLKITKFDKAISHVAVKGSNLFRGKSILTVISHIPDYKIKQIEDTFKYFGSDLDFNTVKTLFYRDRCCQAIGRVLGNRGSKETHLIIHESLLDSIKDVTFPYSTEFSWVPQFDKSEKVLESIEEKSKSAKASKKETEKEVRKKREVISYGMLNDYFEVSPGKVLAVSDVKAYIVSKDIKGISNKKGNTIPVSKVANYFNAEVKNKKLNDKVQRCLIGLDFKMEFKNV